MTPKKQQEWNNWIHKSLTNQIDLTIPILKFRRKLIDEEMKYIEKILKEYYIIHPNFMIDHYGDSICFCLRKV